MDNDCRSLSFRTTKRADQGTEKEKLEDGGQKKN
jgi:hypothetical protein